MADQFLGEFSCLAQEDPQKVAAFLGVIPSGDSGDLFNLFCEPSSHRMVIAVSTEVG